MNSTNKAVKAKTQSSVLADTGQNHLECDICHERFGIKSKLLNHYVQHGLTELFSCNICSLVFYEKSRLDRHYLLHQEVINTYNCEKCEEKFLEKCQLDEHVLHVHDKYSIMYNVRNSSLKKCDTQSKVEISKCEQSNKRKSSDVRNKIGDVKRKCYMKLCTENSKFKFGNRLSDEPSSGISKSSENIFIDDNAFTYKSCTVLINKLPHSVYKECIERGFISLKNYEMYTGLVSHSETKVHTVSKCNSIRNSESSSNTGHKTLNGISPSIKSPSIVKSKSDLKTNSLPKKVNIVKSCQSISHMKQNTVEMNTNQNPHASNSMQSEIKVSTAVNPCYTVVPGCPNKIKYVGPKQRMHLVDHLGNLEKILKRKILYGFISTSARSSAGLIRTNILSCIPQVSEKNVQYPVATKKENDKSENSSQTEENNSLPTSSEMSQSKSAVSNPEEKCGQYLIFDKSYALGIVTSSQNEGKNKSHDMVSAGSDNVNETSNINSVNTVNTLNHNKNKDSEDVDKFNTSDESTTDVNNSATSLDDIIFVPLKPEVLNRIQGKNNKDIPKILLEMGYVPTVKKVRNISTVPVTPELLSKVRGKTCQDTVEMLKEVGFVAEIKGISDTNSLATEPHSLEESKAEEKRKKFEKRKTLEKEKMLRKLLIKLAEKDRKKKKKCKEKKRRRLAEKENLNKWSSSDTEVCRIVKEANIIGVQCSQDMQFESCSNEIKNKYFEKHVEKDMQKMENYSKENICNVKHVTYVEEKQHSKEVEENCSNGNKFKKQILQKPGYSDSNQVDFIGHADERNLCKLNNVKFSERKTVIYSGGETKKQKDFSESVNDIGQQSGIVSEKNVNNTFFKVPLSEPSELNQNKTTTKECMNEVSKSDTEVSSVTQKLPSSKKAEACLKDSFSAKSHATSEACNMFNGSSRKILCSSEVSPKIMFDEAEVKTFSNKIEQNENFQTSENTTYCQDNAGKLVKDNTLEKNAVSMQKSAGNKLGLKKSKNVQKLSKDTRKGSGIKTEAERKVLKKFAEIDRRIKICLSVSNLNVNECLDAMNELDNLSISRGIWKESLKILHTLKKCRKFTKSEIVRQRANELYNKFIKFYTIPSAPVVNTSN